MNGEAVPGDEAKLTEAGAVGSIADVIQAWNHWGRPLGTGRPVALLLAEHLYDRGVRPAGHQAERS